MAQMALEVELTRLQHLTGLAHHLGVVWAPNTNTHLSGEVKNTTIYIYESKEPAAVKVLRHEFIDYIVSQPIVPYKDLVNSLIHMINQHAYQQKEMIVEGLLKILQTDKKST